MSDARRRISERFLDEDLDASDLPDEIQDEVPANATRQVAALTLQQVGDLVVDAKTVLTWLVVALGAPAGVVGLLVPIRESGSMLPQAALAPIVRRLAVRRWVWVLGAVVQAVAVLAMAGVAATLEGAAAGVTLLLALAAFALGRSLSSIASKDVLGRTVPKGARGRVHGIATVAAGVASLTVGLGMRLLGGEQTAATTYAWLLAGAASAWLVAAAVYSTIVEAPTEQGERDRTPTMGPALTLLRDDRTFRRFVLARGLLLVSALSPPFVVALATERGGAGLQGLGAFVLSSGLASLLGGRFWGRAADRSSRWTMTAAAAASVVVVVAFLLALRSDALAGSRWLYPATYLLLALAHTGTRIGRKTYVIDLAEGNRRTDHVAVSNTAMGLLLLVTGGLTSAAASLGVEVALALLAALGAAGVLVSRSLPDVSRGAGT